MNINVRVIPNAKKELIKQEEGLLRVYLTAPAVDGQANKALCEVLACHWGLRKRQVKIIKGLKSRLKVINIIE